MGAAWLGITDAASEGTWVDHAGQALNGRYSSNLSGYFGDPDYAIIDASNGNWVHSQGDGAPNSTPFPIVCHRRADKSEMF